MHRILVIIAITFAAATAGIRHMVDSHPVPPDIQQNLLRWQAHHISHYRYMLVIQCLCGFMHQPYTIEVRDGQMMAAVDSRGQPLSTADVNAPPYSMDWFFRLSSMETLFQYAQTVAAQADQIKLTYDPTYNYPTSIRVDWNKSQSGDEVGLRIIGFRPMP